MHVAICDDNGADRKQLERLLTRESEKRHTDEGTIYADSYGNATNLLANPLQYDAIFIDICHTPGVTVKEIVDTLLEKQEIRVLRHSLIPPNDGGICVGQALAGLAHLAKEGHEN